MARFFNTTGPCDPAWHYMLPPEDRLPNLMPYVRDQLYFVIHAARQTGKTTAMLAFAEVLRQRGYVAVCATLEQSFGMTDIDDAEPVWLESLQSAAAQQLPDAERLPSADPWIRRPTGTRLRAYLEAWCAAVPKPMVLLLDEADTVSGPALVSLLRQLRAGFATRGPGRFPVSIALIGMRDLRDYLAAAKDGTPVSSKSPFNIKKDSLTLRNFNPAEVAALYAQHTADTGQIFTAPALERAWFWTRGQPFLVNALADLCVRHLAPSGEPITEDLINEAKERLVLSRTTHLDSLAERLREERVARIITPVLLGEPSFEVDLGSDDLLYCVDLGLLTTSPRVEVANPLYREVLVRQLSLATQPDLPERAWARGGRLDIPLLVDGFLTFWRRHAEALRRKDQGPYREVVPQLLFMAWLQKVVNGGGRITREYALGRGRIDLLVEYGTETHVIELKRVTEHDSPDTIREEGLVQLAAYLDGLGLTEGWLILFDGRPGLTWEQRLWRQDMEIGGRILHLRGA